MTAVVTLLLVLYILSEHICAKSVLYSSNLLSLLLQIFEKCILTFGDVSTNIAG